MPLNIEQSQTPFALRVVWLFLTWHYPQLFRDKWLEDTVRKRFPDSKFKSASFTRPNPSFETFEIYLDYIRNIVFDRIEKHSSTIEFPDHILDYVNHLEHLNSDITLPFNTSSWSIRSQLNINSLQLKRLVDDIGGFWYVLRPHTHRERATDRAVLEPVQDKDTALSCDVSINVGVLRISTLAHSPGRLPYFRYEAYSNRTLNQWLIGFAFPVSEEIIFQGSFDQNSTGQLTWVYKPQAKAANRSTRHNGILLARNRVGAPIAAPMLCVRIPLSAITDFAPEEASADPRNAAEVHDRHFDVLNERTRDWIGVHTVAALTQAGILTPDDLDAIRSMFDDHTVYRI